MITAHFSKVFLINGRSLNMGCKVSLKNDGKVSITNKWGGIRKSDYYLLERVVKEGVSEKFVDTAFTDIIDDSNANHNNLYYSLIEQTTKFKEEYLLRTQQWAKSRFVQMQRLTEIEIVRERGVAIGDKIGHSKASYAYWNMIRSVVRGGLESYLSKANEDAELHYTSSIKKLVNRIVKKNLNLSNITINTDYTRFGSDGSLETIITDGTTTIKAWTILACGEINAPHYRYLIK